MSIPSTPGMWTPWEQNRRCTRKNEQSCLNFGQNPACLQEPARFSLNLLKMHRVIVGNNRLKRFLSWLLFHSGSKISRDEHPAKLGGSWEGERRVWVSWYHWEPGEGRWAEGDAEINLFFYCIGPRWKSWKLFLLLGQVGQSMTIKLNNNLLIIMNIILKAGLDERKGATLEEMSGLVHQLTLRIGERKARLAPIIKVLIF